MANKTVLDRNKINIVVDPGDFNKTIILLGLAGYKMIVTNSVLRASLPPALLIFHMACFPLFFRAGYQINWPN